MATVATLTLKEGEASVLEAALRYYTDTLFPDLDEMDDEDRVAQATAESIRQRLRKSVERHGYRLVIR